MDGIKGRTFADIITASSTVKPHIIDGMPLIVFGSMILKNVVGRMKTR